MSLRRLVVGDTLFLWRMSWVYDLDGERIVDLSVRFARSSQDARPRGQPLRARFVSREPEYPAATAVALPGDARAAIDRGLALGWKGTQTLWLLPACGLSRPDLVLTGRTRLREWAGGARPYSLHVGDASLAGRLGAELGASPVADTEGAEEAQWRCPRWCVLRSRWGNAASIYSRDLEGLAHAISTVTRCAPKASLSVSALGATIRGPGIGEVPAAEVVPPERWGEIAGAVRHRGPRECDAIWTIPDGESVRVEAYHHHHEGPLRLWRWVSLSREASIERRFR